VTKRILLTDDRLSAGDLQQLGLVTELVAPDAVDRAALLLAQRIAGFEADALEKVKRRANVELVAIWGQGEAPREIG
jgi:enoyl-CoA hydratase/carnithine racemase